MNEAVTAPIFHHHVASMADSASGDDHRLSSKRRRLEDGTPQTVFGAGAGAWDHGQPQQQPSFVAHSDEISPRDDGSHHHFADVQKYSQPYFYGQTDPATYTSPWPPNAVLTTVTDPYEAIARAPLAQHEPSGTLSVYRQAPLDGAGAGDGSYPPSADLAHLHNASAQALQPSYDFDNELQTGAAAYRQPRQPALYIEDASMHLKIQALPVIDSLATQLIQTIARASLSEMQHLMRGGDNEDGQTYNTIKNLFDQTRKVYSRETPFIDSLAIQMFQPNQQEIIRRANIATFISSILGAHDVSFFHLNEYFMETFVPLGHRLLKWQGAVYLELKTQTYISALMNSDGSPEPMLDELFPVDLDAQILTRHPDAPSLSPSEQDFIDRCKARKSRLLGEPSNDETAKELGQRYQWNDFVREFANAVTKNVESILNVPSKSQHLQGGTGADKRIANALQAVQDSAFNGQQLLAQQQASVAGITLPAHVNGQWPSVPGATGALEARDDQPKKASANASTVRQPWTKAEEEALLNGLERVNGPHWSQILTLYGRGGSLSEVLKDRNQVQLKDKARNLKLWYLKTGKEVPTSLKGVTGELRKRGGARTKAALGLMEDDEGLEGGGGGDLRDQQQNATAAAAAAAAAAKAKGKGKAKKK